MKITKLQFQNFLKICEKNNEFLVGNKKYKKQQLEYAMSLQGYWSGLALRYYLDGDDWRTEMRQLGSTDEGITVITLNEDD